MRTVILIVSLMLEMLAPGSALGGEGKEYRIVFIRTGPATDIPSEEQREAFQGHFTNMRRMAEEGDLLIAGPFGDPRPDPMHRGLWIFDTDSDEKALELAATDPPGQLGIFVFESVPLITDDKLRECMRLETEAKARHAADPETAGEWMGREYRIGMIETSEDGAPQRIEGIVLGATLRGVEENPETDGVDHHFVILAAASDDEAREILTKAGCNADAWSLTGWYATTSIMELAELRD